MSDVAGSMNGKICVVTGGNAGIGFVAARELARRGAQVWIVGRNPERVDKAVAAIREAAASAGGTVDRLIADLSSQEEVRGLADAIGRRVERVDVLLNNAGAMFPELGTSADGVEQTFALNQLGYYALTLGVLPLVRKSVAGRIVNVASDAHRGVRAFDVEMFTNMDRYSGWRAYCRSKLANVLFTKALAKRLEGSGVTANALHPGFVASDFLDYPGWKWRVIRPIANVFAISPDAGAKTPVYLASDGAVAGESGKYFEKCEAVTPSPLASDAGNAEALWRRCEELTGLTMDGTR